jgi:hypothetical protein
LIPFLFSSVSFHPSTPYDFDEITNVSVALPFGLDQV